MAGHCGSACPVEGGFYDYVPNVGGNAVLLALFALLVPVVLYLGYRHRTPLFSVSLTTGVLFEVLGFIGRILLHGSRDHEGYFFLSQFGTVLGPVFMTAAVFLILLHVIVVCGEDASPFKASSLGFVLYAFAALGFILELIGVIFVAYGFHGISRDEGADITAAGLSVQAAMLVLSSLLLFWFILGLGPRTTNLSIKHATVYASPRFKRFSMALHVAIILLTIFSVYRLVEYAGDVSGHLFQSQASFMVIGGIFPLLSCILLTIFHPGEAFGKAWSTTSPRSTTRPHSIEVGLPVHNRYDPEIRKQLSPKSPNSQRQYRASLNPPSTLAGSPGLPPNPRPISKSMTPTESSSPGSSTQDKRSSARAERERNFSLPHRDLVNSDDVW